MSDLSNPTPTGESPEIEVLYAGNLADDDMMWVARCSVAEFARLLLSPLEWVAALGSLPSWKAVGGGEAPTLLPDFAMLAQPTETADPQDWVTVQGISDTNELSVVASRAACALAAAQALAKPADDPFPAFWDKVSADPANPPSFKKILPLVSVLANARFYLHFEILDRDQSREDQARREAAFLLGAIGDPEGYAAMLNGLDQRPLLVDGGPPQPGKTIQILPSAAPTAVYANMRGQGDAGAPEGPPVEACDAADGPLNYVPGTGTLAGTMIKRYGSGWTSTGN